MTTDRPPSRRRYGRPLRLLILFLLVVASLVFWRNHVATYHLATVQQGVLYRDGNRGINTFLTGIRKAKPKTIVCLIDANELADHNKPQFAAELKQAPGEGANIIRIPIPLGGWPTSDDIQKFLAIVADKSNQPVLVHCAQGVRRTGMLVAAYQQSVLGYDKAQAKAAILSFGHKEKTIDDVKRFIDLYDPATRSLTTQPAMTGVE